MTTTVSALSVPLLNGSSHEPLKPLWRRLDWIIPVSINIFLIFLTFWIFFSLVHYGIRNNKWKKMKRRNDLKLSSGIIYSSTIFCAFAALCRLTASQMSFSVGLGGGQDVECERISDALRSLYCIMLFSGYVFLWLRQRIFYKHNMMQVKFNCLLKVFSFTSIFLLFTSGLCVLLFQSVPITHPSSVDGCIFRPGNEDNKTSTLIIGSVFVTLGQAMLVFLFIYPLKRFICEGSCLMLALSTTDARDSRTEFSSTAQSSFNAENSHYQPSNPSSDAAEGAEHPVTLPRLRSRRSPTMKTIKFVSRIMLRTIIFAIISVIIDVLLLITTYYALPKDGNRRVSNILYDLNTFGNLMLVICSFSSYSEMLASPCHRQTLQ